jgi:DNA-binding XRE family transcriptional regulator
MFTTYSARRRLSHFVVLAEIGAAARPSPRDIELWKLWLAELICLKINCEERPLTQSYPKGYLSDPRHTLRTPYDTLPVGEGSHQTGSKDVVFEGKTITVHRLFKASALLCDRLESEARADASRGGHPADGPASPARRSPGRKPGTVEIDGDALKQLRKQRELTQKAFARVLKISDDTLGRIERGEPVASDSSEQVIKICKRRGWIVPKLT